MFSTRLTMLHRANAIGRSVCPSVRLSHAWATRTTFAAKRHTFPKYS